MRKIRKRPRADKLENQKRKQSSNIGRRVYLAVLALFALSLSNYMWGDFFILRGNGLVLRDQAVVAATFVARVSDVFVEEGQSVRKGDVLMKLESTEVLERLANLSIKGAELSQRAAELQLRSQVVLQLLPLASKREMETDKMLIDIKNMSEQGLLTSTRYEQALTANFIAREELVRLSTENKTLSTQISALGIARRDAQKAVKNLEDHYSSGIIRASKAGVVGMEIPWVGKVYRAGVPMLSILVGENYVLAYLPSRYLFSIRPGMKVVVSSGRHRDEGVIEDILPVSEALPREFQNNFKPTDRSQLARIKLSNKVKFPTFEKVEISLSYF